MLDTQEREIIAKEFCDTWGMNATVTFIGNEVPPLWGGNNSAHPKYRITVTKDGKTRWFIFYAGCYTGEPTVLDLFECLKMDWYSVKDNDYIDFCNEFGFDANDRNSKKTYDAIKENNRKLYDLFGSNSAVEDIWEDME